MSVIVETHDRTIGIDPGGSGTVYLRVLKEGEGESAILEPADARVIGHALIEYADRK